MKRQYFWTAIKNTQFSLVITYPEAYGDYRLQVRTEDEIHRLSIKGNNAKSFFSGTRWRIHPKWWVLQYISNIFLLIDLIWISVLQALL